MAVSMITKLFGSFVAYAVVLISIMTLTFENCIPLNIYYTILFASFAVLMTLLYGIYKTSKPKRLMFRLE